MRLAVILPIIFLYYSPVLAESCYEPRELVLYSDQFLFVNGISFRRANIYLDKSDSIIHWGQEITLIKRPNETIEPRIEELKIKYLNVPYVVSLVNSGLSIEDAINRCRVMENKFRESFHRIFRSAKSSDIEIMINRVREMDNFGEVVKYLEWNPEMKRIYYRFYSYSSLVAINPSAEKIVQNNQGDETQIKNDWCEFIDDMFLYFSESNDGVIRFISVYDGITQCGYYHSFEEFNNEVKRQVRVGMIEESEASRIGESNENE